MVIQGKARAQAGRSALEETLAVQLKMAGLLPRCTREYVFAPPRKFRFDFAFLHAMVAIEVEGGSWVNGAHNRGGHFESDCDKYNLAVATGWRVLRFTGKRVKDGTALAMIEAVLEPSMVLGRELRKRLPPDWNQGRP